MASNGWNGARAALAAVAVWAGVAAPAPAFAQMEMSPSQMRREIAELEAEREQLRATVAELQGQLASMRSQIVDLERRLRSIAQLGLSVAPPSMPAEAAAAAAGEPLASPGAMFEGVRTSYAERFEDDLDAGRIPELDEVRSWARGVGELGGRAVWYARLDEIEPEPDDDAETPRDDARRSVGRGDRGVRFTLVDPATMIAIDRPVVLELGPRAMRRVEAMPEALAWRLAVRVEPEAVVDPARVEPGPFNHPPFVGPFVAFRQAVEVVSIDSLDEAALARLTGRDEAENAETPGTEAEDAEAESPDQ